MTLSKEEEDKLRIVFRFILVIIVATLLLSNKVWITERNFPMIPMFSFIPEIPSPIDYIIYSLLVVLCLIQIIYVDNKRNLQVLVGLFAILFIGDQMRWQPFNVIYFFTLAGMLLKFSKPQWILPALRLLVVFSFLWTGIQQLNPIFHKYIFPWMSEPVVSIFPSSVEPFLYKMGYVFSVVYILVAIGLLIERFRTIAVYFGIGIHVFLFINYGPLGHDYNRVSLTYNVAMAVLTYLLFYKELFHFRDIIKVKSNPYAILAIVWFGVFPGLNYVGLFDTMQSFGSNSGKATYAKIYVSETVIEKLPPGMRKSIYRPPGERPYIETTYWAMDALKVTPYCEARVFEQMRDYICSFETGPCTSELELYTYADVVGAYDQ